MSLKQLIAKVGMARATFFNNTSLPPWERRWPFEVCNICQSFTFISMKTFLRDLPIMWRRLRYFSYCYVALHPHWDNTTSWISFSTFWLKIMILFSLFMHWLEVREYCSSISSILWEEILSALQKIKLSSVNSKWFTLGAPWQILTPVRVFDIATLFSKLTSPSVHNRNR